MSIPKRILPSCSTIFLFFVVYRSPPKHHNLYFDIFFCFYA